MCVFSRNELSGVSLSGQPPRIGLIGETGIRLGVLVQFDTSKVLRFFQ